jgi:hypothetical protein
LILTDRGKREHKGKMNTANPTCQFIILLLLLIISAVSCQQPELPAGNATDNASLETVFEIPEGTAPQRAETYDDIVYCQRFNTYRANCPYVGPKTGPDWEPGPDYIRGVEVSLSGCQFAPSVGYRDHIETRAGEIRYNMFLVSLQTSSVNIDEVTQIYRQTGKPAVNYEIKLRGTCPDILVKKIREAPGYALSFRLGDKDFYLMMEISPQAKPGDYTLYIIVEANGQNCGELPCVIHVTE